MTGLMYQDAGVDIAMADSFIEQIKHLATATHNAQVLPNRGEYAALFQPDLRGIHTPVLAATCDGVGTKLLIAQQMGRYKGLGQDLVAMNVNDLLPCGAKPLFFLDYLATGKLDNQSMGELLEGIALACQMAQCALLGGETAEMPGVYKPGEFDIAGFAVGLVDKQHIPQPHTLSVGDKVLALPATGVHANGLSLARKALFEVGGLNLQTWIPELGQILGEVLLEPTPIYVQPVHELLRLVPIKVAAHVTGGGLLGRGKKLVPDHLTLQLNRSAFDVPFIFDCIACAGGITPVEMAKTFNMGLGYIVVIGADCLIPQKTWPAPWRHVGEIVARKNLAAVHMID